MIFPMDATPASRGSGKKIRHVTKTMKTLLMVFEDGEIRLKPRIYTNGQEFVKPFQKDRSLLYMDVVNGSEKREISRKINLRALTGE